jgi:CheY-like chemotaxis protein
MLRAQPARPGFRRKKGEFLTPDLGHAMTSTTSSPQRARAGAVIVLSTGQGHDPDDPRTEGLTGRSTGYQAAMTQRQDSQRQELPPDTESAPRVLLVDDAAAIRNALRGVLEDAGIEVVGEAPDGVEGVALTGSLRPDVVLMDLRMPSSDGFQATAAIVQEHPDVRVVVLSAYESEESAEAVLAAGAFAFLPKHCGADRIRDTVLAAWRS